MRTNYAHCPNPECEYHGSAPPSWYWRKGSFVTKWNHQPVPRFQCKKCRRTFCTHTFRPIYRQKKPFLNEPLRKSLACCTTIMDSAWALGTTKSTVLRKLKFLGELSKKTCTEMRKKDESKTDYVQFDEIETSHRTLLLPLSIAFAVRPKTGEIISAHVAEKPCLNNLSRLSRDHYGYRTDKREGSVRAMLRDIKEVVRTPGNFTIASDKLINYRDWVSSELPFAKHERHSGNDLKIRERAMALVDSHEPVDFRELDEPGQYWIKRRKNGTLIKKAFDPLFHINQKCAVLRASMSRLRKHFWGFTQKVENLEHHLWLFIGVNNGYKLRY